MGRPIILVTNSSFAPSLQAVVRVADARTSLHILTGGKGVAEVLDRLISPECILICFSTGVVIPAALLGRLARAGYNFHAASPEYPGRDPHHFAVYERAKWYGATAHKLTAKVDTGPIVGVKRFPVVPGTGPDVLRGMAACAALQLYSRLMPRMMREEAELPEIDVIWSSKRRRRRDFCNMCRVEPTIRRHEFDRRYFAFDGGTYDNLVLNIHGRCFRIQKGMDPEKPVTERIVRYIEPFIKTDVLEANCLALRTGQIDAVQVMFHDHLFQLELDPGL